MRTLALLQSSAFAAIALVAAQGAHAGPYLQTNLVSDIPGLAIITDPALRNPWGVSHSPTSPIWVSDQVTNLSTLYAVTAAGVTKNPLEVVIPQTDAGPQGPTGQVFNTFIASNPSAFQVNGTAANFIFANLNGTISARSSGASAQIVAPSTGGVYTGLAISSGPTPLLFAANGAQDRIDVFDSAFANVTYQFTGKFVDPCL